MRRLILIAVPSRDGSQRFPLKEGDQVIGRSSTCDIIIPDKDVSRNHAKVSVKHGNVVVADLDSRNGTYIDGRVVKTSVLYPRQQIRFGSSEFRLELTGADQASGIDEETHSRHRSKGPDLSDPASCLTPAQLKVFYLLLEAKKEQEIAAILGVKYTTVHTHVGKIYEIFNVNSRAQLMARVRQSEN